ncbi:MAG: transcription termination factor Rho [Gemmatimonadaceae bacterium]|jgi:transcription termination factor Rho|nr:transcription termination factor Rho [Gemmatimonadaceae bacterium]MCC6431506.1 transcription termination factor Rho [Gemmatimonadaceae bacterium]
MNERKRPARRGRPRSTPSPDNAGDENPYLDAPDTGPSPRPPAAPVAEAAPPPRPTPPPEPVVERSAGDQLERIQRMEQMDRLERAERAPSTDRPERPDRNGPRPERPNRNRGERPDRGERTDGPVSGDDRGFRRNGRRGRNRFRRPGGGGGGGGGGGAPAGVPNNEPVFDRNPTTITPVEGAILGWFDPSRDGGFLRRPQNSYLPEPTDPFIPPALVRLHQLRRGDKLEVSYGRDQRGRHVVIEVLQLNDGSPVVLEKRPDFNTLTASYPDRKLTLETGKPAKTGPELTRRAIDLIAPIGYGQRALIVAPARAGKTTLLQAIVEGVAINHPHAALLVLLVDERPEEVSEMVTWGYGEVVASSFDMPAKRHVEVAEMTLERARRLVELGQDVVIVLDSITRLARAYNTVERGTGRTMSGGLDSSAMQKPKAFFGSARMIAPQHGGGSLSIIATALVETGSRMDEVIFEEFKGTGNCEIKLDRGLADRRIYPAFDIATSGTRREEKLYRPDQLDKVHLLRRGLHQLPPQAGMEWLIKRIAATSNNDSLLDGL